jgi:hypothetical protein
MKKLHDVDAMLFDEPEKLRGLLERGQPIYSFQWQQQGRGASLFELAEDFVICPENANITFVTLLVYARNQVEQMFLCPGPVLQAVYDKKDFNALWR